MNNDLETVNNHDGTWALLLLDKDGGYIHLGTLTDEGNKLLWRHLMADPRKPSNDNALLGVGA